MTNCWAVADAGKVGSGLLPPSLPDAKVRIGNRITRVSQGRAGLEPGAEWGIPPAELPPPQAGCGERADVAGLLISYTDKGQGQSGDLLLAVGPHSGVEQVA